MAKNEIPREYLDKLEPTDYADGDFDLEVWKEEAMDAKADDMTGHNRGSGRKKKPTGKSK